MSTVSSFDLFLYVGGYWSEEGLYHGGEAHMVGRISADGFTLNSVSLYVRELYGYEENMRKVSWFPPETPHKKEDIEDDELLRIKVLHYALGSGAMTLYVVREDDPYIGRHLGIKVVRLSDEIPEEEEEQNEQSGSDSEADDDIVEQEEEEEEQNEASDSSGESELADVAAQVDESKYQNFRLGQEYSSIESFKSAITRYAVRKRRDLRYEKSDSKRVVVICSNKKCPWRISASINSSSIRLVVRAFNDVHTCTWQGKVSLLTNARIAEIYLEEFRINPHISAKQLQKKLMKRNINVAETICERTRLRCLQTFDDEQAESFARIHDYVAELKKTNPGSTVECEVRDSKFHRFYVCFHGLKEGWKSSCRKIIHLDGTFLKWRMTGQLLVACGRDPNDQMFPIAWGIVDVENKENWEWFFEHLAEDLGLETGNGLTLASDQCKGLIGAVKDVLPFAEHRLCARHVHANWKKKYSGADFEDLFWGAADSYYIAAFKRRMNELKELSQSAYDDLKISVYCPWSRAYFSEYSKCDAVENNLGESFNAAIRIARTKPVVEMLEDIRRCVMTSNAKKRSEAEKAKGDYTPRARALLEQQIHKTKDCIPLSCGLGEYEVAYFSDRFVVQMRGEISCGCRMYKVSGITCCHIISALRMERRLDQDPNSLISHWFTVEKLKRCYKTPLKAVGGMNMWDSTDARVKPPPYKKPPGRPPGKKRKREAGEARPGMIPRRGIKIHCGLCGQEGHNRLYCKSLPVDKPPKNPPGRPRIRAVTAASSSQVPGISASSSQAPMVSSALVAQSQPMEDLPSLSAALPKRGRGRPRKSQFDGASSSQPNPATRGEPIYDTGPVHLPREGVGLFTSFFTGDDYVSVGSRVTDTNDNTILPSSLYRTREKKKLAVRANKSGK